MKNLQKIILWALAFTLLQAVCHAQPASWKKEYDRIYGVVQEGKVDAQLLADAKRLLEASTKADTTYMAALDAVAYCNFYLGNAAEAQRQYEEVMPLYSKEKGANSLEVGRCHAFIGFCHSQQQRPDPALANLGKAIEIIAIAKGKRDDEEVMSCLVEKANVHAFLQSDLDKALAVYEEAANMAERINKVTHNMALGAYYGAIYIHKQRKNYDKIARYGWTALSALKEDFSFWGWEDMAISTSSALLRYANGENPTQEQLRRGVILQERMGKYYVAKKDQAKTAEERTQMMELAAQVFKNAGYFQNELGQYGRAADAYKLAIGISPPESKYLPEIYSYAARMLHQAGDYGTAIQYYQNGLSLQQKVAGKQNLLYVQLLNNSVKTYLAIEKLDAASKNITEATQIFEKLPSYDATTAIEIFLNRANMKRLGGDYADAIDTYKRLITAAQAATPPIGKDDPLYWEILAGLGTAYRSANNMQEAEPLLKEVMNLQLKKFGEKSLKLANIYEQLALFYEKKLDIEQAGNYFVKLANLYKENYGPNHPKFISAIGDVGLSYINLTAFDKAEVALGESIGLAVKHFQMHSFGLSEAERYTMAKGIHRQLQNFNAMGVVYSLSEHPKVKDMLRQQMPNAKFSPTTGSTWYNVLLNAKGTMLFTAKNIKQLVASSNNATVKKDFARWESLKDEVSKAVLMPAVERQALGIDVDSLTEQIAGLERQISGEVGGMAQARLVGWKDVQAHLQNNEAAIEMIRGEMEEAGKTYIYYVALLITSESVLPVCMYINDVQLETTFFQHYQQYRASGAQGQDVDSYENYWGLIARLLDKRTKVYLAADGIYHKINLNTIFNPYTKKYLIEEVDIQYVTSTRDILDFGREKRRDTYQARLFGRPAYKANEELPEPEEVLAMGGVREKTASLAELYGQSFTDLPEAEIEVQVTAGIMSKQGWKAETFLRGKASEEEVKRSKNPDILHLSTHGLFLPEQAGSVKKGKVNFANKATAAADPNVHKTSIDPMLRSGVILAGVSTYFNNPSHSGDDGVLTAQEAANLQLNGTEVVVLSACQTALGEVSNGEGVYGLQRAFMLAGAKSIVMSLWNVDAKVTQELLNLFYEKWAKTGKKREAFRQAQIEIKNKYPNPYYWGAFILLGE